MTDRPISFSAPMVRALLAGRKTQTRRLVSPSAKQKEFGCIPGMAFCPGASIGGQWIQFDHPKGGPFTCIRKPYEIGDRLYVREHWKTMALHNGLSPTNLGEKYRKGIYSRADACPIEYLADGSRAGNWAYPHEEDVSDGWKPGKHRHAMHMPRWASRLTLNVTEVKVERLQSISDDDAWSEGVCSAVEADDRKNGKPAWGDIPNHYRRLIVDQNFGGPAKAFNWLWDTLHGRDSWEANPWVVAIGFRVARGNIDILSQKESA